MPKSKRHEKLPLASSSAGLDTASAHQFGGELSGSIPDRRRDAAAAMDDYGEETGLTREMKAAADAGPTRSDTDTKWLSLIHISEPTRPY